MKMIVCWATYFQFLLLKEEEPSASRGRRVANESGFDGFLNVFVHSLSFRTRQGKDMTPGQSNGHWGGSEVAHNLLKTSHRSRYSSGTPVKSAASTCNTGDTDTGGEATPRQHAWQDWLQYIIWLRDQSTWGLCWTNQGCPRTRLALGYSMRNSTTNLRWLPDTTRLAQGVVCVIMATGH